jgi:hypothetical protein
MTCCPKTNVKKLFRLAKTTASKTNQQVTGDRRHRNNCKHVIVDGSLASKLWDRLKQVVPQQYEIKAENKHLPPGFKMDSVRDMVGTWTPCGVNKHFSLFYYDGGTPDSVGGHFGPHRDTYIVLGDHQRSILTLAVYLVDRPKNNGGATSFLKDDMGMPKVDDKGRITSPKECIEAQVQADVAGKAAFFHHDLMHEGEPLEVRSEDGAVREQERAAPKWLLISQILYCRDPKTAPKLTFDQQEARRWLGLAEEAEMKGDVTEATKFYNRAYKLDPSLEFP